MKLSEAVLKGCGGTKKVKLTYLTGNRRGSCVLGAAYVGITGFPSAHEVVSDDDIEDALGKYFPELYTEGGENITCPLCTFAEDSRWMMVTHLNDSHAWSRENIASWYAQTFEKENV